MRILHLADLHIGKRIFGYSMLEDQRYFFNKTIDFIKNENIKAVIIAGDIFDNGSPSAEAMTVLDEFLNALAINEIKCLLIPGNHDVAGRFNYGSSFFRAKNIFMVNDIKDSLNPITLDGVNYYMVPFFNHHDVNRLLNKEYKTYEEALVGLLDEIKLDEAATNILALHQLVLPAKGELEREGSEDAVVGTLGNISAGVIKNFSYVALGHIHKPQNVGSNIRYCGSPLAYHSDEAKIEKSYTVIEVNDNKVRYYTKPIIPLRNVVVLKGRLDDVLVNHQENINDYVYVKLTDEVIIENLMAKIKSVYPYALNVEYAKIMNSSYEFKNEIDIEDVKIDELFYKFYQMQNDEEMSSYQKNVLNEVLEGEE